MLPGLSEISVLWILLAGMFALPIRAPSNEVTVAHTWATHSDFDRATRDRFLDLSSDPPGVRLAGSYLLAEDLGITVRHAEPVTATNWARQEFQLPLQETFGALLLFFGGGAPLTIDVNGHPVLHEASEFNGGGWDRQEIPGEFLRAGENHFVFRAEGNATGTLYVDPVPTDPSGLQPGSSAKSEDAGQTWSREHLGARGDLTGKYLVHLRVKGYPPRGTLVSEVLDLAALAAPNGICPPAEIRTVRLEAEKDTPEGTAIPFEVRTGSTPTPHYRTWSPWRPLQETDSLLWERYLQWRARLTTSRGHRSPLLRRVTVTALLTADSAGMESLQVVESHNALLTRSSYPFTYESPHPRVRFLKEKYGLAQVGEGAASELEAQTLLRDWTRRQWLRGWDFGKYNYIPRWDAFDILEAARSGFSLGMCTHYATVYSQAATALGFIGRHLILDHHCLAEVWIDQLGKWVAMDPGNSPAHPEYNCHFEREGIPLNALEIHQARARGELGQVETIYRPPLPPFPANRLQEHDQVTCDSYIRFGIPLRNDHLSTPEPQEEEHGQAHYHYNGYLWWEDDLNNPRFPEYAFLTNRPGDFYWTVNEVALDLTATGQENILRVTLDTVTPNFETYLAQFGTEPWQPVPATFEWPLRPGMNRLAVKTRNLFSREGRPSHVTVRYEARKE